MFNFVPPADSEELLKAAGSGQPGVTNLEVAVDKDGGSEVFTHVAGADPFNEAKAFCAKYVTAVRKLNCAYSITTIALFSPLLAKKNISELLHY